MSDCRTEAQWPEWRKMKDSWHTCHKGVRFRIRAVNGTPPWLPSIVWLHVHRPLPRLRHGEWVIVNYEKCGTSEMAGAIVRRMMRELPEMPGVHDEIARRVEEVL